MAILKRLNNPDSDDDNDKIKVANVQFFFGSPDSATIMYQCGRLGKLGHFKPSETVSLIVANRDAGPGEETASTDWTDFNAARTKNNQTSAENWLVTKGVAAI